MSGVMLQAELRLEDVAALSTGPCCVLADRV